MLLLRREHWPIRSESMFDESKCFYKNEQLRIIDSWCRAKQNAENMELNVLYYAPHNYFEEFYVEFNLPNSVGLKRQSEVINQNLDFNNLYKCHRNLISSIKYICDKLSKDIERGYFNAKEYLTDITLSLQNYNYVDSINDELRKRNVEGV